MAEIVCGGCGGKVGIVSNFANGDEVMLFCLMYSDDNSMHRFIFWAEKEKKFIRVIEIGDDCEDNSHKQARTD